MSKRVLTSTYWSMGMLTCLAIYLAAEWNVVAFPHWFANVSGLFFIILLFLLAVWYGAATFHNFRHPTDRVPLILLPPELREEDEGMKFFSYKACRAVYVYYFFSFPVLIVSALLFEMNRDVLLLSLLVLFLGQFLTYQLAVRNLLKGGDDD
ncbi:hypothetical protein [Bacillus fonticola]|uniref:hypothetical protein n=1 Tax=Bacillus fonticola TaxID=2728853 RepID=UPI001473E643|nr:hypothetical protein [Bacillus fonticola]